jgi:TorA maturation chaperone TorD
MTLSVGQAELADVAGRRSGTWWLLSRLVIEQPQEPWLEELESALGAVDPTSSASLGPESAALLQAVRTARVQADGLTELAVDRTSLLAGVMHKNTLPAPFESAALGQDMNSDLVIDVVRCYQGAGLEDYGRELGPPDFLGTELRFMSILAYQEMLAHQAADASLAESWLAMQRHFLETHLVDWVPTHCERMAQLSKTDFYASASRLIQAACLLDLQTLIDLGASAVDFVIEEPIVIVENRA